MNRTLLSLALACIYALSIPLSAQEFDPKSDPYSGKTVRSPADGNRLIRKRQGNVPKVGEQAPEFDLNRADGSGSVRLSDYRNKQPVVLVFGSYT
ncbi:MAG: redoxin domain-containing protein [Planctomycetota bacterium]|jgi:hypothetical protein|nr:redoxin domain-containing protein [Planctomycetota bacterium]